MSNETRPLGRCCECGWVGDLDSMYRHPTYDLLLCPDCKRVIDRNDYIQGAEQ